MRRGIVWFRNNLRTRDNESLAKAARECDEIFPVYIIDPRMFRELAFGFRKTGPYRKQFLVEALNNLNKNLTTMGSGLIIRHGMPEDILPELVDQWHIQKVYSTKETGTEEVELETTLETRLTQRKIILEASWQHTLLHEEDVPWPIRQVPDVFTSFRKESEKTVTIRNEFPKPKSLKTPASIEYGKIADFIDSKSDITDSRGVVNFEGGEDAAWQRLDYYFWESDLLKSYKGTRNGLIGGDYSSKLSPWLSMGCISPRSVYFEIKRYEKERKKNISTYWLFFELLWRDFFRFMSKKYGSAIFQYNGLQGTPPEFTEDMDKFKAWQNGETGEEFVDANMKELLLTGYMSNRGRQNTASYLIYDLGIKWTWGAAWFENRLIDYDPSSNWLNWAYIAGVGNDPRKGRHFSIESQSAKYDPKGEYVNHWLESDTIT